MRRTRTRKKPPSAEQIARIAERGGDITRHFTNLGKMMPPIQRVNVDFTDSMLKELDTASAEMNVSRQAVIKLLLRQALDQHYLAHKAREA
jgi:hypothetical protein